MKKKDVHLLVFDSLSDWEASYAVAGINNPQFQKNPGNYRVRSVALRKFPVVTIGGIRIQPDLVLEELSPTDSTMFIMPGGIAWDEGKNVEAVEVARTFLAANIPVAAICGATAGLARGGLLDKRRHTSNAREYLAATQYAGTELYEDTSAVTDNNLITAPAMAPVDFAYHIFKCLDIYSPPVLEAWYGLFKTGRAEYFGELMKAMNKNNKDKKVSLKKFDRMAAASYQNALRLHEDAIMLFKKKRYPSAYSLSVLSLEEIGKSFWLDDFVYHNRIDRWKPEQAEEFIRNIYNHRAKQNMFSYGNHPLNNNQKIVNFINSGKIENQKQESMYVGLPKIKNKINLFGKISIPTKKITENHALKQITFVNDYIICTIAGLKKEAYEEDIKEVENILNYKLMKRLLKLWPHMSSTAKKRYAYLMKHPDVEDI